MAVLAPVEFASADWSVLVSNAAPTVSGQSRDFVVRSLIALGLAVLATVRDALGSLDKVKRLVKTLGWVNCTADFTDQPKVINGFSELMKDVFGEDADRIVVDRANARRHLAFGHGIHRCVGARLAELQISVLMEEMAKRRMRVNVVGEPTRVAACFVHGYRSLPVEISRY